ncbi:MAG TPA: hypothetical protein VGD71_40170 [Kribbella sp.]|jgi:hypothetical protein
MLESFNVNLELFGPAKTMVDKAAAHYGGLAEPDLRMQAESLRDLGAFEGGHGVTGQFQRQLAAFGEAWMDMFGEFIDDERDFAAFLRGFSERLVATHKLYQDTELRNEARFLEIARSLDRTGES